MSKTLVRVALGQILVVPGQPDANIARALTAIDAAAHIGADLLVLPECLDFGWTHDSARIGAEPIPGPSAAMLAARAGAAGVMLAAGLSERDGDHVFNTAILVERDGRLLGKHRKVSELDFARSLYRTGRKLEVFDTSFGPIGLAVCADLLAPEIGAGLCRLGARLILSPSAWAVPETHDEAHTPYGDEWRQAYGAIAAGFAVPVASASNVGRIEGGAWHGRPVIGRSLAMAGDGRVAALGGYDVEDMPVAEIELAT